MGTPIDNVNWVEKNEMLDDLLKQKGILTTHPIDQGFEAEVIKICSEHESFVLKIWNKSSKPDICFQFQLLNVLVEQGLAVSKPLGWGINPNGDHVLLTTFDGTPIHKVNAKKMTDLANILSSLPPMILRGHIPYNKYTYQSGMPKCFVPLIY